MTSNTFPSPSKLEVRVVTGLELTPHPVAGYATSPSKEVVTGLELTPHREALAHLRISVFRD